jgi:hypothetical protein
MRDLALVVLALALASALSGQGLSPNRPMRCFIPAYSEPNREDSLEYAATIVLAPGVNTGRVDSRGFGADTIGFWRMFVNDAVWVEHGDSIQLQFSNGFTSVNYYMRIIGDSLVGRARILFDAQVQGRPVPTIGVVARPVRCPPRRPGAP